MREEKVGIGPAFSSLDITSSSPHQVKLFPNTPLPLIVSGILPTCTSGNSWSCRSLDRVFPALGMESCRIGEAAKYGHEERTRGLIRRVLLRQGSWNDGRPSNL